MDAFDLFVQIAAFLINEPYWNAQGHADFNRDARMSAFSLKERHSTTLFYLNFCFYLLARAVIYLCICCCCCCCCCVVNASLLICMCNDVQVDAQRTETRKRVFVFISNFRSVWFSYSLTKIWSNQVNNAT